MEYRFGGCCDQGCCRESNQDSLFLASDSFGGQEAVFGVICDGVGSLAGSGYASAAVVLRLREWFSGCLPARTLSEDPLPQLSASLTEALAAAGREKLCAVLQITDTGLTPGSGVGNHRREVSQKTLGVPVLALGLPTVIRADQLIGEEAPAEGEALFVTPRDIDQRVRELSRMMAYGVDLALQPHLTVEDVTGLLG